MSKTALVLGASGQVGSAVIPALLGDGDTPWSVPKPYVMDMSAATESLGYHPVADYTEALPTTVDWIAGRLHGRDWREAFPSFLRANRPHPFDYAAEDAWVAQS